MTTEDTPPAVLLPIVIPSDAPPDVLSPIGIANDVPPTILSHIDKPTVLSTIKPTVCILTAINNNAISSSPPPKSPVLPNKLVFETSDDDSVEYVCDDSKCEIEDMTLDEKFEEMADDEKRKAIMYQITLIITRKERTFFR